MTGSQRDMSLRRSITLVVCCITLLSSTARADEDQPQPQPQPEEHTIAFELAGDRVIVRDGNKERPLNVGCTARSFTSKGTRAYVLCGASTIVMIDAMPEPHVSLRERLLDRILSLTTIDGVVSARSDAGVKPLAEYSVAPSSAPPELPVEAPVKKPRRRYYGSEDYALRKKQEVPPVRGFEIDATATGGVGVDNIAGAFTTLDAAFIYRFDVPFSIAGYATVGAATGAFDGGEANVGPRGGDVQVATSEAVISVDAPVVAVGLGIGVGLLDNGYNVEPLFVLRGRIGEVDTFEFRWHMAFATSGPTIIGVFGGALEFRLSPAWWIGAEAELGNLRYGRFMGSVRRRLVAQKDHKGSTLDLRAGIGLAYVHSSSECNTSFSNINRSTSECIGTNTDYLGPAVSIGLVFRP